VRLHARPGRSIRRCRCGYVFVDPLPSRDTVADLEVEAFRSGLLEETREMFAAYGRTYREDDPVVRGFVEHLATLERLAPGRRLLDVGVGTGLLLHLARARGWEASGVDIAPDAAARAREEFGVEVAVGDFLTADVPGDRDAITMSDVLEHTPDPPAFLDRARRLLAPRGVLFVVVPNHRSLLFHATDVLGRLPAVGGAVVDRVYAPNHYHYFTPATLGRLAAAVGFEIALATQESPYLGRYRMNPVVRAGLTTILAAGRALGRESRLVLFLRRAR
jgi:SAM-dependent methyltransferase